MQEIQEFIFNRFEELDHGIVATPATRLNLEQFARANGGSMDIVLMQMAINFGYKMAMEDINELINK